MNRTPLRRTGPPKRRKGLKRRSVFEAGPFAGFIKVIGAELARQATLNRDGYRCRRCKKSPKRLHVHHKLPRSRGGSDHESNLLTLCGKCHGAIHDHTAPDWRDFIVSKKHA